MHSIRPRPICRARNTFSPAIALWQHFIAPHQQLTGRPLKSSFATEAAHTGNDENERPGHQDLSAGSHAIPIGQGGGTLVRKSNRTPGFTAKRDPSVRRSGRFIDSPVKIRMGDPYRGSASRYVDKLLKAAYDAYDASEDYQGVMVSAMDLQVDVQDHKLPWNIRAYKELRPDQKLNLEIRKFYEYIRPSPIESVARKHVIEQVCQHVRNYLPGYVLEVFGSERTGLSFARSDIDLRLVPENRYRNSTEAHLPPTPEERFQMKGDLRKLHTRLLSRHKDSYLQPTVLWARYPLISMRDRASGLDIQIVLSNDTTLSRQFIQRYQEEYPFINEVYSVLKATLDVRGLSDVFKGGVGSYPLFMMLVACLKHRPSACNDAQSALLGFLAFWGTFKAQKHGISIEPPEFLANTSPVMSGAAMGNVEKGRTAPPPSWMLKLRDPADETNDLGRRIVAWKHIQATFKYLNRRLHKDLEVNERASLLATFLRVVYNTDERTLRKQLSSYGLSLSEAGAMPDDVYAMSGETLSADHGELDDIAQSIKKYRGPIRKVPFQKGPVADAEAVSRAYEEAKKQPAADIEAAMEAAKTDDVQGINTWLKDIEEASEHKQTGDAFANILGLNKKADK